jgi:Uma2 family endonuclease
MVISLEQKKYSIEEYLEKETAADFKSEYRNGEVIPMAGGTANHNRIAGNFYFHCLPSAQKLNCEVFIGDMHLWIEEHRLYTYPDIMIIIGEPIYEGNKQTAVTNPVIVIEVLSESTRSYDRGDKFRFYRSISTLKEYILIDQSEYYIEQFSRTDNNSWLFNEYSGSEAKLNLVNLELQIALTDIYRRVDFDSQERNILKDVKSDNRPTS